MGLLFKARSQDIKGKPKIYFSAETTDYSKYLEPICEEILKYQNCSIWYPESEADRSAEDFLDDISDMQLFVIPVTSSLIFRSSGNVKREFDLAVARHIPVLPIMVEDDLSEPFNRIFGELQYLDRYKADETAIKYEEKLEKFLSSVLVGDELVAKIRAAFDAYVFLSYRKKDRKHAQELMRLIHKNEFCRDIAIWYDEFLSPGENFNDAIRDALRKSELFVLTVTPNLVNELNYIATTEYPLAKSENKTIVPAELVSTDRAQLTEIFADLPDCTDAHDDARLSEALLSSLAGVAVRENDGDNEHNFFIGLAYLSGIDVEVDHARALRLITESAEAGLLEAMDQLVRMYRSGTGVPRDMEKALYWQEQKISALHNAYNSAPTNESFETLLSELLNCGDSYAETSQPSRCMPLYEEALTLSRKADFPAAGYREAVALRSMGNYVLDFEKNGGRARALTEESVAASRRLHAEQNCERSKRSLATGLYNLGNLCRRTNDTVAARNHTEESERLFSELYKEYGSKDDQEDLIFVRDSLCLLYYKRQDMWEKALEYAKENLKYFENEAAEKKTANAKGNLAMAYSRLHNVYWSAPRSIMLDYYTENKEAAQRSYEISKELCEENPSIFNKRSLSITCRQLANVTSNDPALCGEAVRLLREIFEESPTARAKDDLAYILIWSCYGKNDCLPNYLKATQLREELVRELGTEDSMLTLSQTYQNLATEYQKQACDPQDPWKYVTYDKAPAAYDKVEEYYKKSIGILEELSSRSTTGEYLDDLAYTYNKFGDIYSYAGRKQDAEATMRACISIYEKQFAIKESAHACYGLLSRRSREFGPFGCLSATVEERLAHLKHCHTAANEYRYLGGYWRPGEAGFKHIAEALETELTEKLSNTENSADRARIHISLAQLYFYLERYEEAERECMCAQKQAEESKKDELLQISIQALELRGDMYLACNHIQSPRDCYTEALHLAQKRSDTEAYVDTSRLLKKSGDAFLAELDLKLDLGGIGPFGLEEIRLLEEENKKTTQFKYHPHDPVNSSNDKAYECYRSALSLLEGKEDITSLRMMAELHSALAGLVIDPDELRQYHEQEAIDILEQIHERMPVSVKAKTDLIEVLLKAGRYYHPGSTRTRRDYLDKALSLADELDKLEYSADVKEALGEICFAIGDIYRTELRDDATAKSAYLRGISAFATVYEEYIDTKLLQISTGNNLANRYFHYAHAYRKDADGYINEGIRVLRDLHEKNLDDLSCAEKYFQACFDWNCLNQEMLYLIEKAKKKKTIEGYITLVRQFRAVAELSHIEEEKARFFRDAYEIMTWLPKEKLDEKGLKELEDATHNAYVFREFHPHLFKDEDSDT